MAHEQQTNTLQRWKGNALQALADNSVTLQVFCPELTPGHTQGTFSAGTTQMSVSTTDINGVPTKTAGTTANHIVAEWYASSNETYPPSIAKGEQVWVFQQGSTSKFYWEAMGRDREKRTTERRRTEIAATPKINQDKTDDNTYFSEWNSKDGYVTIAKTSTANGEPYALYVGLDTKNGRCTITDNKGDSKSKTPNNQFVIDFKNDVFQFTNNQKTTIRIDGQDIFFDAPRDIMFKAGRQILFDTPLTTFNRSKAGAILLNAQYITLAASDDIVLAATRVGINALTKISQTLIAAGVRCASMVTGPIGASYAAITSNPTNGSYSPSSNSSDTDISEIGRAHV